MAGIASQYWITPFGPVLYGISWMPLLFIILIFTFLFAAPSPYERRNISKTNDEKQAASAAVAAMSIYLWLLFYHSVYCNNCWSSYKNCFIKYKLKNGKSN